MPRMGRRVRKRSRQVRSKISTKGRRAAGGARGRRSGWQGVRRRRRLALSGCSARRGR
jgi:hypothetical protein